MLDVAGLVGWFLLSLVCLLGIYDISSLDHLVFEGCAKTVKQQWRISLLTVLGPAMVLLQKILQCSMHFHAHNVFQAVWRVLDF